MIQPQVIQGSWEEIAAHAEELKDRQDLLLIVPARQAEQDGSHPSENLLEAMKDFIGASHYGEAHLSENTGKKFAKLLADKHRREQP
jgi:hypothetical protein